MALHPRKQCENHITVIPPLLRHVVVNTKVYGILSCCLFTYYWKPTYPIKARDIPSACQNCDWSCLVMKGRGVSERSRRCSCPDTGRDGGSLFPRDLIHGWSSQECTKKVVFSRPGNQEKKKVPYGVAEQSQQLEDFQINRIRAKERQRKEQNDLFGLPDYLLLSWCVAWQNEQDLSSTTPNTYLHKYRAVVFAYLYVTDPEIILTVPEKHAMEPNVSLVLQYILVWLYWYSMTIFFKTFTLPSIGGMTRHSYDAQSFRTPQLAHFL